MTPWRHVIIRVALLAMLSAGLHLHRPGAHWWMHMLGFAFLAGSITGIANLEAKLLLFKVMEAVRTAK